MTDEVGVSNAAFAYEVVAGEIVEEVVEEVDVDVVVGDVVVNEVDIEMVHPDVDVADSIPYAITDTKVITPSTKLSVHIDKGFPRGPID